MTFDAQSFLDSSVTGSNDTKIIPCPVGEFTGIIDKVAARQWQTGDGQKTGIALDVDWAIDSEEVRAFLNRSEVKVRQGIMLDIDPNTGGLDMGVGKNVGLGRLREALGLNNPNEPFSFGMLAGRVAKVAVTHREYQGDQFAEIRSVTAI